MVADAYEELWRDGSEELVCLMCTAEDEAAEGMINFLYEQTFMVYQNISDSKRRRQLEDRMMSLAVDSKLIQVLSSD